MVETSGMESEKLLPPGDISQVLQEVSLLGRICDLCEVSLVEDQTPYSSPPPPNQVHKA